MLLKIDELKSDISLTFMRTQNLIISSYFDKAFTNISTLQEVETYRRKLYSFKDYLGCVDSYSFFNDYYVSKMEQLEDLYNILESGTFEKSIKVITKKENTFVKLFKTIRNLLFKEKPKKEDIYD